MSARITSLITCCCLAMMTPALLAAPDYWDSRLNQICGLKLTDVSGSVAAGQGYWRLTRAEFQDEQQAGGTHHIYYMVLDINGNPIENQKTWASWPYDSEDSTASQLTKGAVDGYWGNYGMAGTNYTPCYWPYNAWIDQTSSPKGYVGLSDRVCGMGMTNPNGTAAHAHVSFRLYWRWTIKPSAPPIISRSPASFSHTITAGDTLPDDSFTVSNTGGGSLVYNISDNANWLSVSPDSGICTTTANTHQVIYSLDGLTPGNYSATMTITGSGATNSPQTIAVSLTINPRPSPHISRSPADVWIGTTVRANLPAGQMTVANAGIGTLSYNISSDAPWLSVSPPSGSSSGLVNTHDLIYSVATLPVGTYDATITITAAGADNSPQTIAVTVVLDPIFIPGDLDGDMDVDQSDFGILQACLTLTGQGDISPACTAANLDHDMDIDQNDMDIFQRCMRGPGVDGDQECVSSTP
jgi:hypothetical protein